MAAPVPVAMVRDVVLAVAEPVPTQVLEDTLSTAARVAEDDGTTLRSAGRPPLSERAMEIAVDIDGHGQLGIELERCSPDRRAAVRLVMPGSLALRTGRVRRGMVLTSVNGQPTAALCFDDTMALLRNFAQARPLRLGLVEETKDCWWTYETLPKSSMYFDAAQDKWFKNEACARQFALREAAQPRSSQEVQWTCCAGFCSVCDSPNLGGQSGLNPVPRTN
jgi:hypothetical protein